MHPFIVLSLVPIFWISWQLALVTYRYIQSPLRSVRGPTLARFTDAWYLWKIRKGRFEHVNLDLHRRYGRIVRYGPNRYSIDHPEAAKIIYGAGSRFTKSSWYLSFANPGTWTYFADLDTQRHNSNRKLVQNIYSMTALLNYEPYVDECTNLLCQRLEELARHVTTVDMEHWFQCYAFDIIGMITYSMRLGFLDQGEDIGRIIAEVDSDRIYASQIGVFPRLHPYLFTLRNKIFSTKEVGRAYVFKFTNAMISERRSKPKAMSLEPENNDNGVVAIDILTKLLAKHTEDPDRVTFYHVLATCGANMMAGSETVAITLSALLYYLLKRPQSYSKLREEIDAYGGGLTFAEAQNMPYLQAVIKEGMRLHPATGLPMERVVPPGGFKLDGFFFPEGTIVGVNTWVEHRNPLYFGDDADEFCPERWLTEDADRLALMNKHWIPLGMGSRNCIGRHIAILEISKVLPRLVRDFDFMLSDVLSPTGSQWATYNGWFVKPTDFVVHLKPREKQS